MKAEAWIFAICTVFFVFVSPAYWFITGDWTGTSALTMTMLLALMMTIYLGFHPNHLEPRPASRRATQNPDAAGEVGTCPPYRR